jgi:hypothetical protein
MNIIKRLIAVVSKRPDSTPKRVPWYTGPPTFPTDRHYVPSPAPGNVAEFPRRSLVVENDDPLADTKPNRQSVIEAESPHADEATEPIHPTTRLDPGAYDHLFPPAQPGDEDYLEATRPEDRSADEPQDPESPETPDSLPQ